MIRKRVFFPPELNYHRREILSKSLVAQVHGQLNPPLAVALFLGLANLLLDESAIGLLRLRVGFTWVGRIARYHTTIYRPLDRHPPPATSFERAVAREYIWFLGTGRAAHARRNERSTSRLCPFIKPP